VHHNVGPAPVRPPLPRLAELAPPGLDTPGSRARPQCPTTGWATVMTVSGARRTAASFTAHSSARRELPEPSIPTMIPGIFVAPCTRVSASSLSTLDVVAGGIKGRNADNTPIQTALPGDFGPYRGRQRQPSDRFRRPGTRLPACSPGWPHLSHRGRGRRSLVGSLDDPYRPVCVVVVSVTKVLRDA